MFAQTPLPPSAAPSAPPNPAKPAPDSAEPEKNEQKKLTAPDFIFSLQSGFILFNEDGGLNTAPSPVVLWEPGFVMDVVLLKRGGFNLALSSSLHLYWNNYLWENRRPYPAPLENRLAFVLGFLGGLEAKAIFPVFNFLLYSNLGLSADFRLVTEALGLNESDKNDVNEQLPLIRDYFWSNGRLFYPVAGVGFETHLVNGWFLGGAVNVSMPIAELFLGEQIGLEGWRFSFTLSFSRHFQKKVKPKEEEKKEEIAK